MIHVTYSAEPPAAYRVGSNVTLTHNVIQKDDGTWEADTYTVSSMADMADILEQHDELVVEAQRSEMTPEERVLHDVDEATKQIRAEMESVKAQCEYLSILLDAGDDDVE